MKKITLVLFVGLCFLGFGIIQSGCNSRSTNSATENPLGSEPTAAPSDLVRSVNFQLVLPEMPSSSVLASINSDFAQFPKVIFKLNVLGLNSEAKYSTLVKTAYADASGAASVSFSGIPAKTVIGEVLIEGGKVGSYTEFHGASDLVANVDNTVLLSPKGTKTKIDVIAQVIWNLLSTPDFSVPSTSLVQRINAAISGLNLNSPEAYFNATTKTMQRLSHVFVSGSFSLQYFKGIVSSIRTGILPDVSSQPVDFNLGDIKASQNYYFLLSNSGDSAISNITLQSSNPLFLVSPASIDSISSSSQSVVPVIKVTANHGVAQNGIGYVDPMPSGENLATITIIGETSNASGALEPVELRSVMKVNALNCDYTLISSGQQVDFNVWNSSIAGESIGDGNFRQYECVDAKIRNDGNSPFVVHCLNNGWNKDYSEIASLPLLPGETGNLVFNPSRDKIYVKIDTQNVFPNPNKLKINTDGFIYFGVIRIENPGTGPVASGTIASETIPSRGNR